MKIQHVAVWVRSLEAMKDFYTLKLGGRAGQRYDNNKTGFSSYFIEFDGGAAVELMSRKDIAEGGKETFGYAHLAYSLGGKTEVNAFTEKMRRDGVEVVSGPRVTGDGCYESCILDPEGNRIEMTC